MESGDEDDVYSGNGRDWDKTDKNLMTEGYREGVTKAKDEEIQKYFEIVQQLLFKNTFRLGQLRGIIICRAYVTKNGEISASFKDILKELAEEVLTIKQLRLPQGANFDEFMKTSSDEMDKHFLCFKKRILTEDPSCQIHLDSQEVGTRWPKLTPAPI